MMNGCCPDCGQPFDRIAELEAERDGWNRWIGQVEAENKRLREALEQLRTGDVSHIINRHIDRALNTPTSQEVDNG